VGSSGTAASRSATARSSRIIAAADAVQFAESAPLALDRAERLRALFDAHLLREDRELIAAASSPSVDGRRLEWSAVLATELQEVHARDHVRIANAIALASQATDVLDQRDACDHATAALSQHAAVMATRAYPMARRLLSAADWETIRSLRRDLRGAERALRHLNRTLRGAAGEDLHNLERLWEEVAQAWQRHIADEEPLIRRLAPLLRPEQAIPLITRLRRPAGLSLTRPHPSLLRGGLTTRMAIHAQYRMISGVTSSTTERTCVPETDPPTRGSLALTSTRRSRRPFSCMPQPAQANRRSTDLLIVGGACATPLACGIPMVAG
jgi:hypothetical protein